MVRMVSWDECTIPLTTLAVDNPVVKPSLQITVSLALVAFICCGAGYAVGREQLRRTDLHRFYQQVNRDSFNGELPDAQAEWADLDDTYGQTQLYSDGSAEIHMDRASVTSERQLRETMQHEACHVFVGSVPERDWHGEKWQACMKRFE